MPLYFNCSAKTIPYHQLKTNQISYSNFFKEAKHWSFPKKKEW